MVTTATQFKFNDNVTFEQNIAVFAEKLCECDAVSGPILTAALSGLADEIQDISALRNDLFAVLEVNSQETTGGTLQSVASADPTPLPVSAPVGWFLVKIEIEGFRGINNEGAPLTLKFNPECVSTISAPNGVGKSSIYDALSFALKGKIPKLDRLLQAESPQDYYLNKFHPGDFGTIKLTLRPDNGAVEVSLTVTRTAAGDRSVNGPSGVDIDALLSDLNREFVLLDSMTFQRFIDDKALDRGRAFSGLLGLERYSTLRQQLNALCNTRAFNTHFETTAHAQKKASVDRRVTMAKSSIATDYEELVKETFIVDALPEDTQQRCHAALNAIPVLSDHCASRTFMEIDVDECVNLVKAAEGGTKRERLTTVIQDQAKWSEANKNIPTKEGLAKLITLATARENALKATSGELLQNLYRLSEQVMFESDWPSPMLCPTCNQNNELSVLDEVQERLGQYNVVEATTRAVRKEWLANANGWGGFIELEKLATTEGETLLLRKLMNSGESGTISSKDMGELASYFLAIQQRAANHIASLTAERVQLENELPPSLVVVTTAVEIARRLKVSWQALTIAENELSVERARMLRVEHLKAFLDKASTIFANAESKLASERLQNVEPLCRDLFQNIMFSPVVPALQKSEGKEEFGIRLAEFWGLTDVSAQALLSESYRNGFAVSVYLAAATLYSGAPRFVILDDVTSSFDAGHQHHLIEVIRTRFSRPEQPDGPQVILLSHDTLLEKLFNKNSGSRKWSHQRLEGTARTAVLPQSGAVNKVRDATTDLLNAGRIDDAAPRIRQYLEYSLHTVISQCRIPVPLDLAFGDDKRTPGEYLNAIKSAVDLERRAGTLIIDDSQLQNLELHSATIIGNFLAHWSTGQTHAFSAPALLGVMQAIDNFPNSFKYERNPGEPRSFYASLNRR